MKARIITNPVDDRAFTRHVAHAANQAETPEALEQLLRRDYPNVRVVRGVIDVVERWYAYRDGRWTRV